MNTLSDDLPSDLKMTRRANAATAGFAFLIYIACAFPESVLMQKATGGISVPARLASVAQHTGNLRIAIVLNILSAFCAIVLAVTLFALTRDEDADIARLGFACRVAEGVVGAVPFTSLGLLWLATATGPMAPDAAGAQTIAALLFKFGGWQSLTAATVFALGSTAFTFLLLRGRMIPRPLAWIGVLGSAIVLIMLPLELAGWIQGAVTQWAWAPLAVFEIVTGFWFIVRGVETPVRR